MLAATEGRWKDAYFNLANLYKNGLHNYEKALPYLYKSLENGDIDANLQLADMYQDGLGVDRD